MGSELPAAATHPSKTRPKSVDRGYLKAGGCSTCLRSRSFVIDSLLR